MGYVWSSELVLEHLLVFYKKPTLILYLPLIRLKDYPQRGTLFQKGLTLPVVTFQT